MTKTKQTAAGLGAWLDCFSMARTGVMAGLCVFFASGLFVQAPVQAQADDGSDNSAPFDLRLERLVGELSPSFVSVQVATTVNKPQLGLAQDLILMQTISAIVIDTGGYLLCAASLLVDEDSMSLTHQGIKYSVKRVGIDYRSGLALLKTTAILLRPVTLEADPLSVGAMSLFLRATSGNRLEPMIAFSSGASEVAGYIEFGGPVGSGAVGGAFFNMSGQMVGIALGALDGELNTNRVFAVPAARIEPILSRLRCCGDRHAGYLGVQVMDTELFGVDQSLLSSRYMSGKRSVGKRIENDQGLQYTSIANVASAESSASDILQAALVTYVEPGSPAEFSGLALGDVVFRFENYEVSNAANLRDFVRGCRPDSVIHLAVLRGDSRVNLSARIGAAPTLQPIQSATLLESNAAGSDSHNSEVAGLKRLIRSLDERIRLLEKSLAGEEK